LQLPRVPVFRIKFRGVLYFVLLPEKVPGWIVIRENTKKRSLIKHKHLRNYIYAINVNKRFPISIPYEWRKVYEDKFPNDMNFGRNAAMLTKVLYYELVTIQNGYIELINGRTINYTHEDYMNRRAKVLTKGNQLYIITENSLIEKDRKQKDLTDFRG